MKHLGPANKQTSESGFTMIELLVATSMMIVICAAAVAMLVAVLKAQPKVSGQADKVADARVAVDKMVRDFRQATEVVSSTGRREVTVKTYIHSNPCNATPSASTAATLCRVKYVCEAATKICTRTPEAAAGGSAGTTQRIAEKVLNAETVFCYLPSTEASTCGERSGTPTYIGAVLQLESTGGRKTSLEEGAVMRGTTTNLTR